MSEIVSDYLICLYDKQFVWQIMHDDKMFSIHSTKRYDNTFDILSPPNQKEYTYRFGHCDIIVSSQRVYKIWDISSNIYDTSDTIAIDLS